MQIVPSNINIGVERANHKQFDDAAVVDKLENPTRIFQIKIQYDDQKIIGIKLKYQGANGKKIKGQCRTKFFAGLGLVPGIKTEKVKLAGDDFIKQIYGNADLSIYQFGFTTYKGVNHTFGNQNGKQFSYSFPYHTFTSASGSYDNFLDQISFRVVPLTEDQLKKLGLSLPDGFTKIKSKSPIKKDNPQVKQLQKQQSQTISEKFKDARDKVIIKTFLKGAFLCGKIAEANIKQRNFTQ